MTDITVQYERKFSDGNYGSEGLSLSWSVTYDDGDSDLAADQTVIEARCAHITKALRASVLSELAKSRSNRVSLSAEYELRTAEPVLVTPDRGPDSLEDMPF